MNLRLQKIAEMVKAGMIMADIGTDHAQLPVWLVSKGRVPYAYACDVAEGPLSAAQETVSQAGLNDQIRTILSDGFEKVPEDCECAVIAGMGCQTAVMILDQAEKRLKNLKQIIVQVNTDVPVMRRWISDHGCSVDGEAVVRDRRHDYVIISFTMHPHAPYSEQEIVCGILLDAENDEVYREYAERRIGTLEFILSRREDGQLRHELGLWKNAIKKHG